MESLEAIKGALQLAVNFEVGCTLLSAECTEVLCALENRDYHISQLESELAALKAANEWHPASEPPPVWKAVLLRVGLTCYSGYWSGSRYVISLFDSDAIPDVKAWCFFPALPEVKG